MKTRKKKSGRKATTNPDHRPRHNFPLPSIEQIEAKHEDPVACGELATGAGAEAMAAVRSCADALETVVADELWPLPKYREMLFPV